MRLNPHGHGEPTHDHVTNWDCDPAGTIVVEVVDGLVVDVVGGVVDVVGGVVDVVGGLVVVGGGSVVVVVGVVEVVAGSVVVVVGSGWTSSSKAKLNG